MTARNIPFVGWSVAAQNFRCLAAERASDPISVLIVGEHGVGKRLMARVWQRISGASRKEVEVVDLDRERPTLLPRCIAHSSRPPDHKRTGIDSSGRGAPPPHNAPWHLGYGRFAPIPPDECEATPLPTSLVSAFNLVLYMPPLRTRMIDVLAVLHALAMKADSADRGRVSSALIHRLLSHSQWEGNVAELIGYLRARTATVPVWRSVKTPEPGVGLSDTADHTRTRGRKTKAAASPGAAHEPPDWLLEDEACDRLDVDQRPGGTRYGHTFLPSFGRPGGDMHRPDWICEDKAVPLRRLPIVACSILLEDFFNHLDPDGPAAPHLGRVDLWTGCPAEEPDGSSKPAPAADTSPPAIMPEDSSEAKHRVDHPRHLVKVRRSNSKPTLVAESSSKPAGWVLPPGLTPTWSWGGLESRLATASPHEFLDEYVYGLKFPPGESIKLAAALTAHTAFGATLTSLQDGIGLTLCDSYRELYNWLPSIKLPTVQRKRPGRPKKQRLTDEEKRLLILTRSNESEFTIEEISLEMGITEERVGELLESLKKKEVLRDKLSSTKELKPWDQLKYKKKL